MASITRRRSSWVGVLPIALLLLPIASASADDSAGDCGHGVAVVGNVTYVAHQSTMGHALRLDCLHNAAEGLAVYPPVLGEERRHFN